MPYLLDPDNHPVLSTDLTALAELLHNIERRRIAYDELEVGQGDVLTLSTVFLVLEHGQDDHGRPLLYETLISATRQGIPAEDSFVTRKATRDEALSYHRSMLAGFRLELNFRALFPGAASPAPVAPTAAAPPPTSTAYDLIDEDD